MFVDAYNVLANIQVKNWYLGDITGLQAFSTESVLNKADQNKIRRRLLKAGYKCIFINGILFNLIKLA